MTRRATVDDIPAIKKIANQYKDELGFVNRASLERAIEKRELFVADPAGEVVGFVNWHTRRDGWSTVYEIAVDKGAQGQGIGRALLYAVPCPIRLKCTVDNERANAFYRGAGMRLASTEPGKRRALNVWEMRVLLILCAGNNTRFPEVARLSGMAYGSRHDNQIRSWPYMVDINWKQYDWQKYLTLVAKHRPVAAMVPDYEYPAQRRQLYRQIRDLHEAGVLRVMVCPKFIGAVAHIPSWCIVAISTPSEYAGFVPPMDELKGRQVHLLGGSPVKQRDLMLKISGAGGHVLSLDGNSHTKTASKGGYWRDAKWNFDREAFDYYDLCIMSGRNIQREMNQISEIAQLPLF